MTRKLNLTRRGGNAVIYYTETKIGRKSIYKKVIADDSGNVLSEREVEIPLYRIDRNGQPFYLLYDDEMNVLSEPSSYLNFELSGSLNTKNRCANALRLLYVFLSLANYDVRHIGQEQLNELIRFLQGLNSNPEAFRTETTRSNDTVNGYLSVTAHSSGRNTFVPKHCLTQRLSVRR